MTSMSSESSSASKRRRVSLNAKTIDVDDYALALSERNEKARRNPIDLRHTDPIEEKRAARRARRLERSQLRAFQGCHYTILQNDTEPTANGTARAGRRKKPQEFLHSNDSQAGLEIIVVD